MVYHVFFGLTTVNFHKGYFNVILYLVILRHVFVKMIRLYCTFSTHHIMLCISRHFSRPLILPTQPAFQRWFTGESMSGTMVESTLDYVSILQIGSTLILWRCFTVKSWRCFTVEIVTLFHREIVTLFPRLTFSIGELRSFCRRWINVELCVDFANWINVDIVTLFHRRTFNMSEYTTVRSITT